MDIVEALRGQGEACRRLGSPMYAELLARAADDAGAGGVVAHVLREHRDDPGPSAMALRLMGSVHRLVLERRAGRLATFYPSVGGTWEPEGGTAAFLELLGEQPAAVEEWLDRPPQTNEVGRAAALVAGLMSLGPLPVRLFEIGSSGGLNLLADRFRYVGPGGVLGPASPVVLDPAWSGPPPAGSVWPRVVERAGSDVLPVDVTSTEGRLALTAYVWADQAARHERLRGALALAQAQPPVVRRRSAAAFVDDLVPAAGTMTVLWHSVMWQYLDAAEQQHVRARIDELGAAATPDVPFAHVFLERTRRVPDAEHELLVVVERWPGGERGILASAPGHGVPISWEPASAP